MKRKVKISESSVVPIVNDGAIATLGVGEGRMVPVLVVDCSNIVELRDLIYAHENAAPGDVEICWVVLKRNKNKIALLIKFSKPAILEILLQFDIGTQGNVVDGILHANALYLQPTESGIKVSEGVQKQKILVEIPDTGFIPKWDKIYSSRMIKKFKKSGFSRTEAKKAAEQHRAMTREIWKHQVKRK